MADDTKTEESKESKDQQADEPKVRSEEASKEQSAYALADAGVEGAGEPSEDRLEELEEHIEEARRDSDDALKGSFYETDHSMFEELSDDAEDGDQYADSGEEAREDPSDTGVDSKSDDQNIAP